MWFRFNVHTDKFKNREKCFKKEYFYLDLLWDDLDIFGGCLIFIAKELFSSGINLIIRVLAISANFLRHVRSF